VWGCPDHHVVVVTKPLNDNHPELVRETYSLLRQSHELSVSRLNSSRFKAMRPALEMIIEYALQQRLISRRFGVAELFSDLTRTMS
jgi:4,5-dihydroxyphthalate decarboxylase